MLGKLFKYEFKAMGRVLIPIYLLTLALSVVTGIFTYYGQRDYDAAAVLQITYVILMSLYFISIICVSVVTFIISIQRFARNLMGKEGYLMHTLPVTPGQHIFVKLITSIVYQFLAAAVSVLAILFLIKAAGASVTEGLNYVIENIPENEWNKVIIYTTHVLLLMLIGVIYGNMAIYTSISIGHSSSSHKISKSFGAYFIIYIIQRVAYQTFAQIFGSLAIRQMTPQIESIENATGFWDVFNILYNMLFSMFTIAEVLTIIFIIAFCIITHYYVKNKLNLE